MNQKFKTLIIVCFIAVPLVSSLISTVHLVDMFFLGNPKWISILIAVAIEIGAVASFLTLSIMSKLNKIIVWSMFFLLFFLQVWGNVYFSYDWVSDKILQDPNWLNNFKEMMEFLSYEMSTQTAKMILSMTIGIPIPLMSLLLLKSTVDYLGKDNENAVNTDTQIHVDLDELEGSVEETTEKKTISQ